MSSCSFISRHIGTLKSSVEQMIQRIGAVSSEQLVNETVPSVIRLERPLNLPEAISEYEYSKHIHELAKKNKLNKSYIGLGYYDCITPPVIQRNILENPGWYTAYTPYQAEISQGRLEGMLNYQTMVMDLTGMDIANASLLDEATAAAEAMIMFYNSRSKDAVNNGFNLFFISEDCFPQTIDVLKTRSKPLGIELIIGNHSEFAFNEKVFGAILQYPACNGDIHEYSEFANEAHNNGTKVAVAADLLSLALLTPPGEWGADAVLGNSQRFGVPLGFGGPHAAFFATRDEFKRNIPGRIIGVSVDKEGRNALRMALQTREQHIRRDKATSNICTAQALLAVMAGMYAVYHGKEGIKAIAKKIHSLSTSLSNELDKLGYKRINQYFFDTITFELPEGLPLKEFQKIALDSQINFNYLNNQIGISLDETTGIADVNKIIKIFALAVNQTATNIDSEQSNIDSNIPNNLVRKSDYLTHPVFSNYRSETEMMRYLKRLENKDISLTHSMISLGSCTMKLNAASELYPISIPEFANLHPFVPTEQMQGYASLVEELGKWLCEITGYTAISFQPNSGAQGEYAGLLVIRAYQESKEEGHRNVALIPASAHGTNPASAVMAGMKVVIVKCDEKGNIDLHDLEEKAAQYKDDLSCLMVTYPSTHGVFEESIMEVTHIIHEQGGQVYMDGANMNAQVGLTNPAIIGADVCHLNLHKTFAIPHGGGGPGIGPIAVATHLAPFLPSHALTPTGGEKGISAVSAAAFGSPLILLISYGYVRMLGGDGLTVSTTRAILNANYLKACLEDDYEVLYKGKNGHIAHEMILDCRQFKRTAKIEVEDIAKRLIDYGFHAPTVSFPVSGTLMIEPTESESKEELDRFCEAMISIRREIAEIEDGIADPSDNVLKNAPHTATAIAADTWEHPYTREKAVFPLDWTRDRKYWSPVSRIDNAYGDRNLMCSCPSIESYEHQQTSTNGIG